MESQHECCTREDYSSPPFLPPVPSSALASLSGHNANVTREKWLEFARDCEDAGFPLTCESECTLLFFGVEALSSSCWPSRVWWLAFDS